MSTRRRVILAVLALLLGGPLLVLGGYWLWRPAPPAGAPRIGLSMASSFVPQRPLYEDALARAGGRAVLITPTDDPAEVSAILDRLDALLLTGGDDVDPALYGGDPGNAGSTDRHRDDFEVQLIRAALDRALPILGICRGVQILNVAHGGSIRNLRRDAALSARHGIDFDSLTAHTIMVTPGTRLAAAIGAGEQEVNSFHGQAVDVVGAGLRVAAIAEDGVVEAVERPDRSFVMGIQWHPEITSYTEPQALRLFQALVKQAEEHRTERGAPQ